MQRRLTVTEARASLFDLFRAVTTKPGSQVVLSHRTSSEQAVLVSKEYVERLEMLSRKEPARGRFRLFGSGTLVAPPDDVVELGRREQAALLDAKMRSLSGASRGRR